ncbi:hypothetical protein DEH84_00560 [Aquabacterium olei]|uniref:Chemotaxis protein n=1 Tax=Aquabacterium olei TaxID=1296669 RepID=A0A2U8FNY4_9BURK|nr:PAS domain-containing methyl-accepting chemotaxis protein [Aquabacterium olei]AWI52104.1 hypothetical protein DEH84_00560 [Aquabacterium olei]
MRSNQPVTQREHDYPGDATLLSTTDPDSRVTYANAAFLAVSGFERDELLGQPHNVVRHPDMPVEAFADMWDTLKKGRSWTALVKNRRKDGDHYWVRANVTPMRRNGQVTGYMSVRTKPRREEVAAAEALYKRFREGAAGSLGFHQGLVIRTGAWRWLSCLQTLGVRARLGAPLLLTGALTMVAAAALGMQGAALAGLGATVAVLGGLSGWWLTCQIARPLAQLERQALSVAAGQPGENIQLDRVDEIGTILRSVNQAGLNLRSLVDDVAEQVRGVGQASEQIAAGNDALSARTEQTSANLEETAASMEQITANVRANADTARQAADLAGRASAAAGQGGEVVGQVVSTMSTISSSSRQIADIIGVIDGIAFQTNILALNAAVEAARAGEQGRGFAVVASEVRSLAKRSAEAAREIKSLIHDSVQKVQDGAALVDSAGQSMAAIVAQVQSVTALINDISEATSEQSSGVAQVGDAVSELDEMTQQNALLVEQAASSAADLHARASRLSEAIGVFARRASPAPRGL